MDKSTPKLIDSDYGSMPDPILKAVDTIGNYSQKLLP